MARLQEMRIKVLDECFKDMSKYYFINDLKDAVNKVLKEKGQLGITKRTIWKDIKFMKDTYGIELCENLKGGKSGREVMFRYKDPTFSIHNKFKKTLTGEETKQLRNTIEMLRRIKGFPNYKDLEQVLVWLKVNFKLDGMSEGTVMFAQNPYLRGLDLFGDLLDMVMGKWKIDILYAPFGRKKHVRTVHPYQLRQWNYRWYLVALEEEKLPTLPTLPYVVIPIDRIEDIKRIYSEGFIPMESDDFDFDRYFENIVGVSMQIGTKKDGVVQPPQPVPVVAKVYYPNASYIFTKPIHWSQTVLFDSLHPKEEKKEEKEDDKPYMVFMWNVIPNEELVQALMVYADQIVIKEPEWVRLKLIDRAKAILGKNGVR